MIPDFLRKLTFFVGLCFIALVGLVLFTVASIGIEGYRTPDEKAGTVARAGLTVLASNVTGNFASSFALFVFASLFGYLVANWRSMSIFTRFDSGLIRTRHQLDEEYVGMQFGKAKKGDQIFILKNWVCSETGHIPPPIHAAIKKAMNAGAEVVIALLHPRSPSTRRRAKELDVRVADRIITTIESLRSLYREVNDSEAKANLRVFCHDLLPTMQLFMIVGSDKKGWAQIAFYPNNAIAKQVEQFEVRLPSILGTQLETHAHRIICKLTGKGGLASPFAEPGDFCEIDLSSPTLEQESVMGDPLDSEAQDVATSLATVDVLNANDFGLKISSHVEECLSTNGFHSDGYRSLVEQLYNASHSTQGDAKRAFAIKSIARSLDTSTIYQELRLMKPGETFYVLDNWMYGDCGLSEFEPMFCEAARKGVNLIFVFLHPNSVHADRRLAEVHEAEITSVRSYIKNTLEGIQQMAERLKSTSFPECAVLGTIEVYCHDCIPSLQVFRGATSTFIGFYLKGMLASSGCQIQVSNDCDFGARVASHIKYVIGDSNRTMRVDLSKSISPQVDGIPLPCQVAEVGEYLANIDPHAINDFVEKIVSQTLRGQVDGFADPFKVRRIASGSKPFNSSSRANTLRSVTTALAMKSMSLKQPLGVPELELLVEIIRHLDGKDLDQLKMAYTKAPISSTLAKKLATLLRNGSKLAQKN